MGEVAVAHFASAHAACGTGFTGGEGGEVVVEQEAFAALVEHVVHNFFVEFGAEGHGGQRLGFAACEHS